MFATLRDEKPQRNIYQRLIILIGLLSSAIIFNVEPTMNIN